jgi:hypothetical protein
MLRQIAIAVFVSLSLAAGAWAAGPPPPPKQGTKLPTAKRRPAPKILTLEPHAKRVSSAELAKGLTPEQKAKLDAKNAKKKKPETVKKEWQPKPRRYLGGLLTPPPGAIKAPRKK